MNNKDFQDVLDRRLKLISEVLGNKAKEYATEDRLHNFKRAASLLGVSSFKALAGMWSKHIVSVLDMVNQVGEKNFSKAYVDEKIGDSINYLILLEAMFEEHYQYQLAELKMEEKEHEKLMEYKAPTCPKCGSIRIRLTEPMIGNSYCCNACGEYFRLSDKLLNGIHGII